MSPSKPESSQNWRKAKRPQKSFLSIEKTTQLLQGIMDPNTSSLQKAKLQFELYESRVPPTR